MTDAVNDRPSATSEDLMVAVTRYAGRIAVVTLDRADKLNALDPVAIEQLDAAFVEIGGDADVQVVMVTGAGRGFCSGADVSLLSGIAESGSALETMQYVCRPMFSLSRLPQVTIAAVNGPAIGRGVGAGDGLRHPDRLDVGELRRDLCPHGPRS